MYIYYNPNPTGRNTGDCTVRAIAKATGKTWAQIYAALCAKGYEMCDMPDANSTWSAYLFENGYKRYILPETYAAGYSIADFAADHPKGVYIVATGTHVVTVENGDIYDTWDSGDKTPLFYFKRG